LCDLENRNLGIVSPIIKKKSGIIGCKYILRFFGCKYRFDFLDVNIVLIFWISAKGHFNSTSNENPPTPTASQPQNFSDVIKLSNFSNASKFIQTCSKQCKNMFLSFFHHFGSYGSFLSDLEFFDFSLSGPLLNHFCIASHRAKNDPKHKISKLPKNHPKTGK